VSLGRCCTHDDQRLRSRLLLPPQSFLGLALRGNSAPLRAQRHSARGRRENCSPALLSALCWAYWCVRGARSVRLFDSHALLPPACCCCVAESAGTRAATACAGERVQRCLGSGGGLPLTAMHQTATSAAAAPRSSRPSRQQLWVAPGAATGARAARCAVYATQWV